MYRSKINKGTLLTAFMDEVRVAFAGKVVRAGYTNPWAYAYGQVMFMGVDTITDLWFRSVLIRAGLYSGVA